jgi:hypothetical protein
MSTAPARRSTCDALCRILRAHSVTCEDAYRELAARAQAVGMRDGNTEQGFAHND